MTIAAAATVQPGEVEQAATPSTSGADDILRLMAQAEAARVARDESKSAETRSTRSPLTALLWACLSVALFAGAYAAFSTIGFSGRALALAIGLTVIAGWVAAKSLLRMLGGAQQGSGADARPQRPPRLAGPQLLSSLGLAERVLDADADARLIARRDGIVVYANAAYAALARAAGVAGPSGLPPRIDRLFAQQGPEATKLFRLCRAARSGAEAVEIVSQAMGLSGGERRRFEVTVRPVPRASDYVAWRLRELGADGAAEHARAEAYADYPRPVLAIEKSGQIAWANEAARTQTLGASAPSPAHLDDVVLGDAAELARRIWSAERAPQAARVRHVGAAAHAAFTPFARAGVGEGVMLCELAIEPETDDASLSGDVSEAPFGIALVEGEIGADARLVEANKAFADAFPGARKDALLARILSPQAIEGLQAEIRRKAASGGALRPVETPSAAEDRQRTLALYARPPRRRRGGYGARRTLLYSVDVSDRKRMEVEHAQDQKLKAIGLLAGEVAHDFNNLLQVVLGNCERLMLRHPAGDPDYQDLVLIRQNAQRAANMTRQLLAFSRKQTLRREVVSMTDLLSDFARFLNGAVGEKVRINLVNGRNLPNVFVDRNQLETAIMNLAVNARDAMAPAGGTLTIATRALTVEDVRAMAPLGFAPQESLLIEVADTGPGVPKEIVDKIFDPFFTTKPEGKGTGLGLSTVHGIVGQMDGAIAVGDAEGGGAVFRIFLPAYAGEIAEKPSAATGPADLSGAGRILIVEDEDAVRNFVVAALKDCGYETTAAEDGAQALELISESAGAFDLVVSDVMMPEMDGPTMISRARAQAGCKAKVLFMSAYAETAVREQLEAVDGASYIQKPFTLKGLAAKVKETLAGPEPLASERASA
jgi:two-component system cell cycle sensor histidine kinase/response regulator CckA